jgi:2-polyprenyl-3-methyl-5-hydroxy-6-metoxy-1,4-benzoquinol methylase
MARPPTENPWDALSVYFDTTRDAADIPAGAADNILIAWPVLLHAITAIPALAGGRALDFGCGAGSFAHALHQRGFRVTGLDPSAAMIARARAAYGAAVDFRVGDWSALAALPPQDVITAIMALQFVPDIAPAMAALAAALAPGGRLLFAVHNPAFFAGDVLRFGDGIAVPIFIRAAADYDALATRHGLRRELEAYPPFTEDFLARYPAYAGRTAPEYLILGYAKP